MTPFNVNGTLGSNWREKTRVINFFSIFTGVLFILVVFFCFFFVLVSYVPWIDPEKWRSLTVCNPHPVVLSELLYVLTSVYLTSNYDIFPDPSQKLYVPCVIKKKHSQQLKKNLEIKFLQIAKHIGILHINTQLITKLVNRNRCQKRKRIALYN